MSTRPWMPLYIADYRADTAHLSAAQHGAYLLLIMHYWSTGALPDDDTQLARIACMTAGEWRKSRPVVQALFTDGWKHKRVEFELTQTAILSAAGRAGGEASGRARRERSLQRLANDRSNDPPTKPEALHLPSLRKKDAADAAPIDPEKDLFQRGKEILGQAAGGLIRQLLRAKKNDVALSRAAIETASTKQDPREYIGRIVRGRDEKSEAIHWQSGIPGIV